MPAQLIRYVDVKLARAKVQVQAITDIVSAWGSRSANVAARCELREGRLGFKLIVEQFADPPPLEEWGVLVGECAHNLRSALDNLAFALARLRRDPPPDPGRIAFPIFTDNRSSKRRRARHLNRCPMRRLS